MLRITLLAALAVVAAARADFKLMGPERVGDDKGEAITCHLPEREHLKNGAGVDGLGLCVFVSIDLAARWANEPALIGFREFMSKHPGGGYPEKVDEFLPKMAASKGLPTPGYVQHTGGDMDFLRKALKTGRYVSVTYDGRDGVCYRARIAHMVNLVHLSDHYAVIQDNNYPGKWLWMSPNEFLTRWKGTGGGWAIVLLRPGPPPIPINLGGRSSAASIQTTADNPMPKADVWEDDEPNFGIVVGKVSGGASYRLNGRAITRSEAYDALGKLPDDADRLRLTIVGDIEYRRRIRADFETHSSFGQIRERVLLQDYSPDHWAVADVGIAPGITLQSSPAADGTAPVLWRIADYGAPEILAGAIRKADPLYRPDRDPDPTKPEPTKPDVSTPDLPKFQPLTWGAIGLALGLLLKRREVP